MYSWLSLWPLLRRQITDIAQTAWIELDTAGDCCSSYFSGSREWNRKLALETVALACGWGQSGKCYNTVLSVPIKIFGSMGRNFFLKRARHGNSGRTADCWLLTADCCSSRLWILRWECWECETGTVMESQNPPARDIVRFRRSWFTGASISRQKASGKSRRFRRKKKCQNLQTTIYSIVVAWNSSQIQIFTLDLLDLWSGWPVLCFFAREN